MKYLILFALTLTTTLIAEDGTENSAPEPMDYSSQPIADNTKPELSEEDGAAITNRNTTTDEVSTPDETSEDTSPIEDIRDIRSAVDLPVETWQIIAISCALFALLLALIYLIRKRRSQHPGISIIPPDPYHKALQELESALQLIQHLDQRPFATGITDAVRGYLAAVFSLPAPECTTEEVLEQLPSVTLLTEEIRQNIIHLLQRCDLAKFTKLQFDQPSRLELYHQAKAFIQSADKLIQLQNVNTPEA